MKCCKILLKHGASLTTEEGSFDENLIETAGDVSSNIKDLLENYKCNYRKVQTLAETINQFSRWISVYVCFMKYALMKNTL